MTNRWENSGNSDKLYIFGAPKSLQVVTATVNETEEVTSMSWKIMDFETK